MIQNTCPVFGCGRHISDAEHLCAHHWRLADPYQQFQLQAAARRLDAPAPSPEVYAYRHRRYRDLRHDTATAVASREWMTQ